MAKRGKKHSNKRVRSQVSDHGASKDSGSKQEPKKIRFQSLEATILAAECIADFRRGVDKQS